jgi:putative zinc finger/helix-turn-helix YgiT family protein
MKTKTSNPTESIPCFECEGGMLQPILEEYVTHHPKLGDITIPDVPMLRCDQCGDVVIGDEGNDRIDAFIDAALHVISPEEIQAFLTKYNLTQRRASEITGFGEKNISRWLTGRARPSESVSNFLRVLLADEQAFERLKQKNFSDDKTISCPVEDRQPDSNEKEILHCVDYSGLVKMGVVAKTRSPRERRRQLCALTRSADLIEFGQTMEQCMKRMAAFKDTGQKWNTVSGGLWGWLGEQAARKVETAPYSRDKLREAVAQLRELTPHPLASIADDVHSILARAGVALVFIPTMKESALRGCTRLLTPSKAIIIHGLKYRSISQFWIILFHEIAHLLLHISKPGESFADYEEQSGDSKEMAADEWAYDTLVSLDRELELRANSPNPQPWEVARFAETIRVHPAIVAEIFNHRSGKEVISFAYMKKKKMFPHLSDEETKALMATLAIGRG